MEARTRRPQIRIGDSGRDSGGGGAFSRNGFHRDGRLIAVRTVHTFIYSVPADQLTPNSLETKMEVCV